MDKRLEKRHKRQVARAKAKVKTSEPDVRTPEEIAAARASSKAPAFQAGAASLPSGPTSRRSSITSPSKTGGE